jgi:hypothetical protein
MQSATGRRKRSRIGLFWVRRGPATLRALSGLLLLILSFIAVFALLNQVNEYRDAEHLPREIRLNPLDWTGVGALAALLTFGINILLLLTLLVGFRSLREGQTSRSAQVLSWAVAQMESVKADERSLRSAPADYEEWNEDIVRSANRICNAYQRMCYFANNSLIDPVHFRRMWGINIVIYWSILERYVQNERAKFNDWPTAADGAYLRGDFEKLAIAFERHFERANPGMIETCLAGRKPPEDLPNATGCDLDRQSNL